MGTVKKIVQAIPKSVDSVDRLRESRIEPLRRRNLWKPTFAGILVDLDDLDLSEADRETVFSVQCSLRRVEAALDEDGLSTTARAVLARIQSADVE